MYLEERLELILQEIKENGRINVKKLSEKFQVTPMTIRRNLSILEEKGLLFKSYGGATSSESLSHDKLYATRKKEKLSEKKKIASSAISFIESGMTVLLDAGTTNYELAKLMVKSTIHNVIVVTNDLKIAIILSERKNFQIVMLGGILENENILTCGVIANKILEELRSLKENVSISLTDSCPEKINIDSEKMEQNRVLATNTLLKFSDFYNIILF